MANANENTFVRITNKDIYKKLCDVEKHVLRTNGSVMVNKWVSRTAITLAILAITMFAGLIWM